MMVSRALAIDGGTPVRATPMPTWPDHGEAELAVIAEALRSGKTNYWTGPHGRALESEYASALGRTHAIAVSNGTLALELALRAFEIGHGDEVIVPARTFIATASAVVAVGATPIIADIDPNSGTLTAETVLRVLTSRTRAIIPVHLGGWPAVMEPILELARLHGLVVVEDCAQAHGAAEPGRAVGSAGSQAAAFSFCQDKIVPAGEGGLLVLDDDTAFERAWSYKEHGKSLERLNETDENASPGAFRWLVDSFGTNWRMHEFAAALARVGLARLPEWHAARRHNALRLALALDGIPGLRVPLPGAGVDHAFYRLYAYVLPNALSPGWDRDRIIRSVIAEGIPCGYGTCCEIYREQAFVSAGLGPTHPLRHARAAHDSCIAFLVHPTLEDVDMDDTAEAIRAVMKAATS